MILGKIPVFFLLPGLILISCRNNGNAGFGTVTIYPDSVLNDLSHKPIGINLDFFMDGGRFPGAKQTVAEAVTKMGMKYLRYPGGEKSDLYLFSLPPYEKADPMLARTGGLEDYPGMFTDNKGFRWDPLDFDEFMAVCSEAGAEPVVTVAADNYLINLKKGETVTPRDKLIEHAAAWVRYANIRMKYGVKYWMIGNESWNRNNQNSTVNIYARDVIDFSRAMKAVDPSILIIPNGDNEKFFQTIITRAGDYIDRLCVSNYGVYDFIKGYSTYRDSVKCLIWPAMTAIGALKKYAPSEQSHRWKIIVSEFGSIDWAGIWNGENDMGHAIVVFDMAGQLLQQPLIEFSCFWNTRWIENEIRAPDHDALDKNGGILPTGRALSIWGNFMEHFMVRTVSSNPLVSYASYSPDKGRLIAYVINKSSQGDSISLDIKDFQIIKLLGISELSAKGPNDKTPVWHKRKARNNGNRSRLKGTSITIFEFAVSPND